MIAESIMDFWRPGNRATIERLRRAGLRFEVEDTGNRPVGDQLKDLTFVVSGYFRTPQPRRHQSKAIEQHGASVSGSISRKTSYVLAGRTWAPPSAGR